MKKSKKLKKKDLIPDQSAKKNLSDNEIVRIVREENPKKYYKIVEKYRGKLFAYLYRLIGSHDEAEDILQNVFIKAYQNLNSFDINRKFSSWIYRIAHNEAINFMKRKKLKHFISLEDISSTKDKLEISTLDENPGDAWARDEKIKEINEAIRRLPFKYRQVLNLRYFKDKSYEEISFKLKKPLNTVGTLINRAKKRLLSEIIAEGKKKKNALMRKKKKRRL